MGNTSFVEVSSGLLEDACDQAIGDIKDRRQEILEESIKHQMTKRFFRKKTREAALAHIKSDCDFFSSYDKIMAHNWDEMHVLTRLKGMSHLSNAVYLSRSDYECVEKYL